MVCQWDCQGGVLLNEGGEMKISGFTFLRNGSKLYYPICESIMSALDLVDEFVVALGAGDSDDTTREMIESIGSDKIRIIDTVWDIDNFPDGTEHAHQTDLAKNACSGDWLLYLQGDEVLHEEDLAVIRNRCKEFLDDRQVDGMVFDYLHFWGDYEHYHLSHGWYKNEVRLVRNDPEIHSFASAQSFRRIPDFDGVSYRRKEGTEKLRCVKAHARIFHYGWVRPPHMMQKKNRYIAVTHVGQRRSDEIFTGAPLEFDYGPLSLTTRYNESHPRVMATKIGSHDWKDKLYESGAGSTHRQRHKHERLKYRFLTFVEQTILRGTPIAESRNYRLLKR